MSDSCVNETQYFVSLRLQMPDYSEYTMYPSLNKFTVSAQAARINVLSWAGIPTVSTYQWVYIQKADNKRGPWRNIGVVKPFERQEYIDHTANNTFHRRGEEWYRLVIPATKIIIGPVTMVGDIDPIGAEIARRHSIMLKEGRNGNPCLLFTRIRDGVRCPACFQPELQERQRADCPVCLDTSYVYGYYNPIRLYVSFSPEQASISAELEGPGSMGGHSQYWTSSYPHIVNGDVIMDEKMHTFHTVKSVKYNTHRRVPTKQEFTMEMFTGNDVIWDLLSRRKPEGEYYTYPEEKTISLENFGGSVYGFEHGSN